MVGLLGAINYLSITPVVKVFLMAALIAFPIINLRIVSVTENNFRRECKRMYAALAIVMKIENMLPNRKELDQRRFFVK